MNEITGMITEIQRFSTGDGPGIRSTVFCKGCNLFCEWCHNPETISKEPQIMYYEHLCKKCGACKKVDYDKRASVCTTGALRLCGHSITASDTASILLEDKPFYDASKGGVTFSGGEPLLQYEFVYEVSKLLKEHNVHIIIDTALNIDYRCIDKINPFVDCYFADLKGTDYDQCYKYTGGNLKLVIDNMKKLIRDEKEVVVRIPVIPGYSNTAAYMKKASQIVKEIGAKSVNLIPFHNYGQCKYNALGKIYKYRSIKSYAKEQLDEFVTLFDNAAIEF